MATQILLCDDEVHIVRAFEFKLKRAGYEVVCAADGEEAWDRIQESLPDLLLTDYQMPRLSGPELIARLRRHEATRELPIMMLTGKGFEVSARMLAEQFGVLAIVSKPFSPREMLRRVAEVCPLQESSPAEAALAASITVDPLSVQT